MFQFGFPNKDSNVPRSYVVIHCLVSLEETGNLKVRPENTDISLAYDSLECTSNTIITCSCSVTIFQPQDRLIYYYSRKKGVIE